MAEKSKTLAELEAEAKEALERLNRINEAKKALQSKADEKFQKNLKKIKDLILESGVTGRIMFDVTPEGVLHKVSKARKPGSGRKKKVNGGNGHHITKDQKTFLAKTKDIPVEDTSKGGNPWFKVGEMEFHATALCQYAILTGCKTATECAKALPMLRQDQCVGVVGRWNREEHWKKVGEILGEDLAYTVND